MTSPGGTTASALYELEKGGYRTGWKHLNTHLSVYFHVYHVYHIYELILILFLYCEVMANAMWAAYRRALELGGENSNVGPGRNRGN